MNTKNFEQYSKMVESASTPSPIVKDTVAAFLVGGIICTVGQILLMLYRSTAMESQTAKSLVSVSLIFAAAVLTAFGVFDKIAKFAGAGTLLPVTGFANAMVSPAMDARSEGYVMGVGNKLFTVCGPVIAYGLLASIIYGAIVWIVSLF